MYKVLLLICAVGLHQSDCNTRTAIHVIQGPDVSGERGCGFQSQAYLAGTAIGRGMTDREYPKILCVRTAIGRDNVG